MSLLATLSLWMVDTLDEVLLPIEELEAVLRPVEWCGGRGKIRVDSSVPSSES